ncbi:MAG: c-type cytochrome [Pyrinomonadaceae bacterium]
MKQITKIFLISVFSLIGFFVVLPAIGTQASTSTVESAVAVKDMRSPYSLNCARCHGGDGRANTSQGRELDADDLTTAKVQNMSTAKITRIIKSGKGDMPAFKNLTAAQIKSVIRQVRAF